MILVLLFLLPILFCAYTGLYGIAAIISAVFLSFTAIVYFYKKYDSARWDKLSPEQRALELKTKKEKLHKLQDEVSQMYSRGNIYY